ncbi:MAG: archease [Alphaproteobacteria bacterium]|nr:archease [Alphaproteobacteria bacterium]
MIASGWEHFPHAADIGIRGFGPTRAAAFEQAALALTAVVTEPGRVVPREVVALICEADDDGALLVEWLNEIVYEMATRRMLFSRLEVALAGHALKGRAWGETIDAARHRPAVEVKGATYTALAVHQEGGRWIAQCVVDV